MATQPMYYGSLVWITPASTTLAANVPAKAAGTTAGVLCSGFSHSNNRLTYTGQTGRVYLVSVSASVIKGAGGSSETDFHLHVNGDEIKPHVGRTIASATDESAVAITALLALKKDDYVELWVETDTGDDLTISEGSAITITVAG